MYNITNVKPRKPNLFKDFFYGEIDTKIEIILRNVLTRIIKDIFDYMIL